MSRRRKTRARAQSLKARREENPFEDFDGSFAELMLHKFLYWLKQNLKQVAIGLSITVVLAAIVVIGIAWMQNTEKKSLVAFEEFVSSHSGSASLTSASLALEDLKKYEDQFSNSNTKIRAALLKTKYLTENEEFVKAAENCVFLAKELETGDLKAYYQLRAGFLFEKAGQNDKALGSYQAVIKTGTEIDIIVVHARYGEIRMLIAAKRAGDARAVLQQLMAVKADRPDIRKLQKQALALVLIQK